MSDGAYIEDEEEFVDELKPGTELMLGQYTIHSFLAAGGFGITYLAKDSLDRYVVIKECFPGSFCRRQNASVLPRSRAHQNELKSIVRMFSQEAMSLSKAGHPNIVGVHQVFEENNTAYMALDYVKGSDLLEILTNSPDWLTPDLVQGFLTKVLSAIGHIHDQGILHRDISPDNIIISESGEPVLIDFGAAREEAGGQASRLLSALRVVKDGYSPQEFYIAGSEQTPSCDLYSLAASFYHIITGELPPDSQSRLTSFAANEPDPYVPLASLGKDYPDNFSTALDKAMSVLPKDRMQSAAEWQAHIDGEALSVARPTAQQGQPQGSKSMLPLLIGGAAAAAVAGVGFVMFSAPSDEVVAEAETIVPVPATPAEETVVAETAAPAPEVNVPEIAAIEPLPEVLSDPDVALVAPSAEQPNVTVDEPVAIEPDVVATAEPEETAVTDTPGIDRAPLTASAPAPRPLPQVADIEEPEVVAEPVPEAPGPSPVVAQTEAVSIFPEEILIGGFNTPEAPLALVTLDVQRDAIVQLASVDRDALPSIDLSSAAPLPEPEPEPQPAPEPAPVEEVAQTEVVEEDDERLPFSAQETPAFMLAQQEGAKENPVVVPTAPVTPTTTETDISASLDVAEVSSIRVVEARAIPFTLAADQPVVETVADGVPFWLVPGLKVSTVNGVAVATAQAAIDQINAAQDDAVLIGVEALFTSAVIERPLEMTQETQTVLTNGFAFAQRVVDGETVTQVAYAPAGSNFRVGDVILSYVSTSEDLGDTLSIADLLERELAAGKTTFSFAVRREGEVWIEAFRLAALQ